MDKNLRAGCLLLIAAALQFPTAGTCIAQEPQSRATSMPRERSCDRACLYKALDGYLDALQIGDGLWGSITKLENCDLRMADPVTGQVAMFGAVRDPRRPVQDPYRP